MQEWRDKDDFKNRVLEWAARLEIKVRSLSVRPMKNKWASCSTSGNLNFNAELLSFDKEIGDYVIVHELLHFSVPNHGRLWKTLMRVYLGDYDGVEKRLRESVEAPHHDLVDDSL
ncbi:MAG: M48 family metallopeptidase [Deltaproteobacteria bacterium]|nr:M48 family metallopeptidase [Deltaproteobacteria bacterium]